MPIQAQNQKEIDSLEAVIPTIKVDSSKLEAINLFCRTIVDIDPHKSIAFAKQALQLATEKDFALYQAIANINIGNGYYNLADYKSCLDYYIKGLAIHERIKNKQGILSCSGSIGNVYLGLGKPDDALKYFQRALKLDMKLVIRMELPPA